MEIVIVSQIFHSGALIESHQVRIAGWPRSSQTAFAWKVEVDGGVEEDHGRLLHLLLHHLHCFPRPARPLGVLLVQLLQRHHLRVEVAGDGGDVPHVGVVDQGGEGDRTSVKIFNNLGTSVAPGHQLGLLSDRDEISRTIQHSVQLSFLLGSLAETELLAEQTKT